MTLDPILLGILACPICKTGLEYRERDSELVCAKCRRHYVVHDDIPNLIPEEVRISPA
jgi:uncharacterized protein YbaR (Trm112 family)